MKEIKTITYESFDGKNFGEDSTKCAEYEENCFEAWLMLNTQLDKLASTARVRRTLKTIFLDSEGKGFQIKPLPTDDKEREKLFKLAANRIPEDEDESTE